MKLKGWIFILCLIAFIAGLISFERRFGFSITNAVLLLLVLLTSIVLIIKLSLNFTWLRSLILNSFSSDRTVISCEFKSGAIGTAVIFLLGTVVGLAVYTDRTNAFYRNLSDAYCRADVLTDVFSAETAVQWPPLRDEFRTSPNPSRVVNPPATGRLTLKQVYVLLRHYNLQDPDDPSEEAFLKSATEGSTNRNSKIASVVNNDNFKFSAGEPTIDLVLALAAGYQGTTNNQDCPVESHVLQRTALVAALAQQPFQAVIPDANRLRTLNRKEDLALLAREPIGRALQRREDPAVTDEQIQLRPGERKTIDCGPYLNNNLTGMGNKLGLWSSFTFQRPEPELTSQELTQLALKWHVPSNQGASQNSTLSDGQADAFLKFMSILLSEMRGTEVVRRERRFVNALIGYERCLVIMLAFVFGIFLFVRFVQRLPQEIHRSEIISKMADFRETWFDSGGRAGAAKRWEEAQELRRRLINGYMSDQPVRHEARRKVTTIPLRILGAALDEMDLSLKAQVPGAKVEDNFVETMCDGERRSLDGSRLVFDTLLPTFPAIGFVGTVTSLLIAMSEADRIVRTDEALARGVAAAQVTDILSLCFSTTLMALLCVLIFSPLSLMQASRERRLIDDTEYSVQTVLRPEQP